MKVQAAYNRNMSHSSQAALNQCGIAAHSVLHLLPKSQADEFLAYITTHNEWLLGIEFFIDYLFEEGKAIASMQYLEFEKAYKLMGIEGDKRLANLRSLVRE